MVFIPIWKIGHSIGTFYRSSNYRAYINHGVSRARLSTVKTSVAPGKGNTRWTIKSLAQSGPLVEEKFLFEESRRTSINPASKQVGVTSSQTIKALMSMDRKNG